MPRGVSLHIGLNQVDPAHYGGWDGKLVACEFDAKDMKALADARGFESRLLLTQEATSSAVIRGITSVTDQLQNGDLFFLTYSGHGGQLPDRNGDEDDGQDETWVLYDRELVDDELYALWGRFKPGVRVLMLSDSCHSGTISRARAYERILSTESITREFPYRQAPRFRVAPEQVQEATYQQHQALYDQIQRDHPQGDRAPVAASIALISGCQDSQLSSDGDRNGLFTEVLLKVWHNGSFRSSYPKFQKAIVRQMPPWQSPRYYTVGAANPAFEAQTPFTI
jgi:metacaspase-1